nr:hypothetical protein [Tanacetum cinerariifolium]
GGCDELGLSAARLSKFLLSGKSVVKHSGDVTRLQALVDKKKIVISEDPIREILRLDDAEGVVCLPNEEIFAGLAQMGYEKSSTKLTFYKAFFSSQWKFLIHTILQSLSAKRTSWNEFSIAMASAVICLSKGQRFNFSRYIFDSLVQNVDSSSKFYMYPRFIQLIIQAQVVDLSSHTTRYISLDLTQKVFSNMRRVGKGCSGVESPLFENMLQVREVDAEEEVKVPAQDVVDQENVIEEIADDVAQPTSPLPPSPKLERLNKVKSSKLRRLKKVSTSQRIKSSEDEENVFNHGRISVNIDEAIELVDDQEKNAQVKGRQADTQAEIYNIDLDHTSKVLSMQEDTEVQEVVEFMNAAKLMTEVATTAASIPIPAVVAISAAKPAAKPKVLKIVPAAPAVSTRKRKGVVIRDPEEELHDDTPAEILSDKDKGKGILVEDPKPMKKKDQIAMDAEYVRKLQEEEESHVQAKDVQAKDALAKWIQYIRRYHGYKKKPQSESKARKNMIAYLKNTEEEMEKEEEEIIRSINETLAQKAAKRKRLHEQAKEDENLKKQLEVVVDEDDDVLIEATLIGRKVPVVNYEIVMINKKPRFSTSKPTNFTDDYLLVTLKNMFEKTDAQDVIWRSQQTEHGQALKYPLSRFTFKQLVNVARLQVEEESEMSLELLRFTRQQLLEYQQE